MVSVINNWKRGYEMDKIKLTASMQNHKEISPRLYGIFFEDINFSIDGGINNNQINNPSLECHCYNFKRDFYWLYFQTQAMYLFHVTIQV